VVAAIASLPAAVLSFHWAERAVVSHARQVLSRKRARTSWVFVKSTNQYFRTISATLSP